MTLQIIVPMKKTIKNKGYRAALKFSNNMKPEYTTRFNKAQRFIDTEVLRYCSPRVPFRTGTLDKSGKLGTKIGSGIIQYNAVYARMQYYTAETRDYDANRGGNWFERMKNENGRDILQGAERILKG